MRIRANVAPTPIVTSLAVQQHKAESQPVVELAPPVPQGEPMVVDLGEKRIELQPGELARVVDKMNETVKIFNHSLQFKVAENRHQIIIRVVDTTSGEVLREIPPEKLMDAFDRMEAALGLLVDLKL